MPHEVRKYLGDRVKPDEVLAVLESRELADLKSQYLVVLRRLDLARATLRRKNACGRRRSRPSRITLWPRRNWRRPRSLWETPRKNSLP